MIEQPPLRQKLRDMATEAMLDAAEACMTRNGFAATTIQQIAAEAGCAVGTIYLHFKTKDDILRAVVERHAKVIFANARAALLSEQEPIRRIQAGLRSFFQYGDQHRAFMRLFFDANPMRHHLIERGLTGTLKIEHDAYDAMEVEAFAAAQKLGQIRRDLPPHRLQQFIGTVAFSMCEEFVTTDNTSLEEYTDLLWKLLSKGMDVREEKK